MFGLSEEKKLNLGLFHTDVWQKLEHMHQRIMTLLIFPEKGRFLWTFSQGISQLIICSIMLFECHHWVLANHPIPKHPQTPAENGTSTNCTSISSSVIYQLPDCMNVTVHKKYFENTTNDGELLINIGYNIGSIPRYQVTPDGNFINFCFPLSPQIFNCNLTKTSHSEYTIHENQTLTINASYSAELGDYYVDDAGNAYSCSQEIRANKEIPRCNYHKVNPYNYVVLNNQFFINASQAFINRPQYQLGEDKVAEICYPMSVDFINCKNARLYIISSNNYEIRSDMTILYTPQNRLISTGEFYKYRNDDVLICVTKKVADEMELLFAITSILYFISSICLLLAIIYQSTIPKLNAYSKCLIGHYSSVLVLFLFQFIGYLNIDHLINETISSTVYTFSWSLFYILTTSAMAWLTAAAFDLWHSFSNSNIVNSGCACRFTLNDRNAFLYYNIFVWIVSILVCILGSIIVKFHQMDMNLQTIFRDFNLEIIIHIGFNTAACVINSIFYVLTFTVIQNGSQGTDLVNKHRRKELLIISGRLFFIMGIHWLVEVITWIIRNQIYFTYYFISGIITALQGVACLIEILCRRGALSNIREALKKLRKC